MRFKTGLLVGAGIGFAVASKLAGDRLDQVTGLIDRMQTHPTVETATTRLSEATQSPRTGVRRVVSKQVKSAGETIRNISERDAGR